MQNNTRRVGVLKLVGVGGIVVGGIVTGVGIAGIIAGIGINVVVAVIGIVIGIAGISASNPTAGTRRPSLPSRAVADISRLFPAEVRDEYREEWASWMSDMRADGTPRVRRWIELLTIVLIAAPRLAISLRLATRRAVDR